MLLICTTWLFRSLCAYILLSTGFVFWNYSMYKFSQRFYQRNQPEKPNKSIVQLSDPEMACQVPKLDPWDPLIINHITHPRSLVCRQVQPNMTFIDINGYLRLTAHAENFLRSSPVKFYCYYRTFDRGLGLDDHAMLYSDENLLAAPTKLKDDMVEVMCEVEHDQFYHNVHVHPAEKEGRTFGTPTEKQLTVVILYLDSISFSLLQRNLPSTYQYTKNVMKMVYFEAFNKVADNSFPNLMAALIGKRVYDEQEGMMREVYANYNEIKYDSWPLIWKSFGAKGYATMFNEDKPHWGLFHYLARGFAKKPVDFYYHSFWWILHLLEDKKHSDYCFGNEPKPRILLDILKRHLVTMQDKLQFLYNFHAELSHDRMNEIERYDDDLRQFWKEMFEGGYLNKTVVIFASDHGHRFSSIRSTLVGLLEERLPFYGIWFPEWFYEMHPKIKENLFYNSKILSSTFDMYETLKDILDGNYEGTQRNLCSRGLSQLYPLPYNRTCASAGIPDHYCTCIKETPLNTELELVVRGAEYLVNTLNSYLADVVSLCHIIRLKRIIFVNELDYDKKVKQGVNSFDAAREAERKNFTNTTVKELQEASFRFAIETDPFNAQFEALTKVQLKNNEFSNWKVIGSVSRINSYKGLSDCMDDAQLRKYCSCKV